MRLMCKELVNAGLRGIRCHRVFMQWHKRRGSAGVIGGSRSSSSSVRDVYGRASRPGMRMWLRSRMRQGDRGRIFVSPTGQAVDAGCLVSLASSAGWFGLAAAYFGLVAGVARGT